MSVQSTKSELDTNWLLSCMCTFNNNGYIEIERYFKKFRNLLFSSMRYFSIYSWSMWLLYLVIAYSMIAKAADNDDAILTDDIDDTGETIVSDIEEDVEAAPSNTMDHITSGDGGSPRISWMIAQPKSIYQIQLKKPVKFLVNFINDAKSREYTLHQISASFRYPADLNYVLQNLTSVQYGNTILPGHVHTFKYGFLLYDEYSPRSVVLIMEAVYSDDLERLYRETLVNQTLTIQESDTGFDGELIFMYILLIALTAGIIFAIYHFTIKKLKGSFSYQSREKKSSSVMSGNIITKHDVDLDWIPKEHIQSYKENRQTDNLRNRNVKKANGYASNEQKSAMATRSTASSSIKRRKVVESTTNGDS
ncbi:hypothetical protein GJ496_008152 [Pomphorhynchus laevis]|nr:hypothetical protein GJ496_008152 [Pomphorhynchus laevis]